MKGNEQIDLATSTKLSPQPYHEADDFYLLHGEKEMSVLLSAGQFLLLEPDKAHKTGISIDKSERIQKIVFKIKV
ncbi:YhcH/YjgK/YiaL family protein [Enterococcus sp. 5B3_DIV0040]|uniref:YhcH/YjgK/YiaL family protein n=1 Tax=Enterococcus sp. 5B3_DIV0040 TaxID=1834182 RepID=UPI0034E862E8